MKIVVLDGYCLNPGDLSWKKLENLGDLTVYDRTSPEEAKERVKDAQILLTNKTPVSRDLIEKANSLEYIGLLATGFNVVDIEAARERNISVTNVPTYGTASVAQMVFAHILNFTQHVAHHAGTVSQGRWSESDDFCYWDFPLIELSDLVLGIVGIGRIGRATAKLGLAFGMKILAYDPAVKVDLPNGVEMASLDTIFRESDFVSLHCPLTSKNVNMVNRETLSMMKKTAYLINTSRGQLVDENALAESLNAGDIAGAGLDVLVTEPPNLDNPLISVKMCVITPHIAWASKSARTRLMQVVIDNIQSYLEGASQNVVN